MLGFLNHYCQFGYPRRFFFGVLLFVGFLLIGIQTSQAATLYQVPVNSSVTVGNIISVNLLVNTEGVAINSADAVLQFPIDLLEVVSINKNASIFTLWVEEPKFTNTAGTITFSGGVPNPGFTGPNGQVVSVVFRAKKAGTATILFGDSSVRKNDGLGTNVLTAKQSATVTIAGTVPVVAPVVAPVVVPIAPPVTPAPVVSLKAPVITSPSHPDSSNWYNTKDLEVKWSLPPGVTSVMTSVGHNPAGVPIVSYNPPISHKEVPNLEDGTWYFNVQFKNANGGSQIGRFKFKIDTVAPGPLTISQTSDEGNQPAISFSATDTDSGVAEYQVKIDDQEFKSVGQATTYQFEGVGPGAHTVSVKAIDGAGNETIQSSQVTVSARALPVITTYPTELKPDQLLQIGGTAEPVTSVEVVLRDSFGQETRQITNTQIDGSFSVLWAKSLTSGSYTLTARAIHKDDLKSDFTEPLTITVTQSLFDEISAFVLNWLSLIIIIALCLGLIILIAVQVFHHGLKIRRRATTSAAGVEALTWDSLGLLQKNTTITVKLLERAKSKRPLSKEEEEILKQSSQTLDRIDGYLKK